MRAGKQPIADGTYTLASSIACCCIAYADANDG